MTMRAFFAHLWKEWREHRWILVAIAAAILLLMGGAAWLLGERASEFWRATPAVVAGGTALTVLALATELFAAEGRRDGFGFLRRTPRALGTAFVAKIAFFLCACAATALWSAAMLVLFTRLVGGDAAVQTVLSDLDAPVTLLATAGAVTLGLWIVMTSTWVSRGATAAGAALLLLALVGAPGFWFLHENPEFPVPVALRTAVLIGLIGVPLVGTAWSLLRGLRFARSAWSPTWRGLLLVTAFAAPCYAAGAHRLQRWLDLAPDDEDAAFSDSYLGNNGRFLFLNVTRRPEYQLKPGEAPPMRPFRIDLETGEAVPLGPLGSHVGIPNDLYYAGWSTRRPPVSAVYVMLIHDGTSTLPTLRWIDADSGRLLKTLPWDVFTDEVRRPLRNDLRRMSSVRTPDGRPLWVFDGKVEHDGPDGTVIHPLPRNVRAMWSDGAGWRGYDSETKNYVWISGADPEGRPLVQPMPAALTRDAMPVYLRLDADRYISRPHRTKANHLSPIWWLVAATTGTKVPLLELDGLDSMVTLLHSGSVLIHRGSNEKHKGGPALLDPTTGAVREIAWPLSGDCVASFEAAGRSGSANGLVFWATTEKGACAVCRLDPETGAVLSWVPVPPKTWGIYLGSTDEATGLFQMGGPSIRRITWSSGKLETLYPRR
jgi:hypothetical protein